MKIWCFVVFIFIADTSYSQALLAEFKSASAMSDFEAITVGDSILFSYSETSVKLARWITEGNKTGETITVSAFSGVRHGSSTYLYYFEGKRSTLELRALEINVVSKSRNDSIVPLSLEGKVLGFYTDKNFFIVLLNNKGTEVTVAEIDGFTIASEKKFALSVSLSSLIGAKTPVDFFAEASEINTFKGREKVRVFKYDKLYITIDSQWLDPESKTSVVTIDLENAATSFDVFPARHKSHVSYVLDGKLFRVTTEKKLFILAVYDLTSKKQISISQIKREDISIPIYFRYGRESVIHNREKFPALMASSASAEPAITVMKHDGRYIIQWGTYHNHNGGMIMGPMPIGFVVSMVWNVVQQLREGPGVHRYFYYEWDEAGNTFKVRNPSTELVREKIDRFEIDQSFRYKYKNYLQYKDGVVGIYYNHKTKVVSLRYFN